MDDLLSQDEINALLSGGEMPASDLSMEDTQILDEVASVFSSAENSVFGMLAGKDVNVRIEETATAPQTEFKEKVSARPFIFSATFGGFDDIPLAIVVDQRGALALADLMMGGEGKELPEEASELYLNAAQEGLSQVVGSAFTSLSGLLGGRRLMPENTVSALGDESWLPFDKLGDDAKVWFSVMNVDIEGLDGFSVRTVIPADSAKAIVDVIQQIMDNNAAASAPEPAASPSPSRPAAASQQAQQTGGMGMGGMGMPQAAPSIRGAQQPGPVVDVHPAEFTPLVSKGAAGGSSKIDLIADIPVRVTVELGKTRKSISEILALSPGSVIELDKMAGEPVDVLVNGKLIAKGEVVVIDENFGVRISEVLNTTSKAYSV